MRSSLRAGRSVAMVRRSEPWLSTKALFFVFLVGLAALWAGISLLFYLEIP